MKEKKTVACVILGVSIVSLISLLVGAFASSLKDLSGNYSDSVKIVGGLTLVAFLFGTAFITAFFVNKKKRFAVNLGLLIAVIAYGVISLIALRIKESYVGDVYLTTALTLMVSAALTFASWLYLTVIKKKETAAPAEEPTEQTSEKGE